MVETQLAAAIVAFGVQQVQQYQALGQNFSPVRPAVARPAAASAVSVAS